MAKVKKPAKSSLEVYDVDIEKIHPNGWNPNEELEETFCALTEEIEEEGFDEPIIVVEDEANPGHYIIIGGEHRYKACRIIGKTEIPCIIKKGWDEVQQKIKTVRRNLLKGFLNPHKFTKLVNDIKRIYQVDDDVLAREMGFKDEEAFLKKYKEEKEKRDEAIKDATKDMQKESGAVDGLSTLLNNIFAEYGNTVPNGFLFFMYKGEMHLMVNCTGKLPGLVTKVVEHMVEEGLDASQVFGTLLGDYAEKKGLTDKK